MTKLIASPATVRCPHCHGLRVFIDRFDHGAFAVCPVCKGKGHVPNATKGRLVLVSSTSQSVDSVSL